MSFNKKYVSEDVRELKKRYIRLGHNKFRREYINYEVTFYSDNESMVFIQHVVFNNRKYFRFIYEFLRFLKIIK